MTAAPSTPNATTSIRIAPAAREQDLSGVATFERDGELWMPIDPHLIRKDTAQPQASPGASDLRIGRDIVITTEHIDRDGDILRSQGDEGGMDWAHYRTRNPIVMLQHGRNLTAFPVVGGNAVLERVVVEGVPGWIAREWTWADTALGRDIAGMWRDTILRTASVGVFPQRWFPIDAQGARLDPEESDAMSRQSGWEIAKSEGREWSIVAVPANPWASRKLWDATYAKARSFFDLAALKLAGKAEGEENEQCPECGADLPAGAHFCPECGHPMEDEEQAAAVAAVVPAPEPEPPKAAQEVGRMLKDVTLERCSACRNVVPYLRAAQVLVGHRTQVGSWCGERTISHESTGPSLKTIADLLRDEATEPPSDVLPARAGALGLLLLAVSDLRSGPKRFQSQLREVTACFKDGRVLSAETRKVIMGALTQVEESLDAMRDAAGALREFLAAVDRRDSVDDKSAPASTAGQPASLGELDALLSAPELAAALRALSTR